MVTTLAPPLLAVFPVLLVAATVFFETEARRAPKVESRFVVVLMALAYGVVVVALVLATAYVFIALTVDSESNAWGEYFADAIRIGSFGSGVYILVSVISVSLRTWHRVKEIGRARRALAPPKTSSNDWYRGIRRVLVGVILVAVTVLLGVIGFTMWAH